jgi:hypothetical protein
MLRSESCDSRLKPWNARGSLAAVSTLFVLLFVASASAQDFTLTASPFNVPAVAPGGTASSSVSIVAGNGFVGPVNLTCTVTPSVQITSPDFPVCAISPTSLTGSGGASATITTTGTTPQIGYIITIQGTDSSGTVTSQPLSLTVLAVAPQFTITVQTAMQPGSVVAGTGAQAVVTVNPLSGYTTPSSGITLYCGSITPLVTIAPICSFSTNSTGLMISGNTPVDSTLTVTTFGPVPTGALTPSRRFYATWLPLPVLALVGLGAAVGGKRSRKGWGLLALFVLSGTILLLPACSNTTANPSTTTPNGITPANTYTFTIVGVDSNGVVSSNTGTNSGGPTVTLTVTAPK